MDDDGDKEADDEQAIAIVLGGVGDGTDAKAYGLADYPGPKEPLEA